MKQMKRLTTLVIAVMMLLTLCACGNKGNNAAGTTTPNANAGKAKTDTWYLGVAGTIFDENRDDVKGAFKDFADTVDPQKLYASIEYTPEMFYGVRVSGHNASAQAMEKFRKTATFENVEFNDGAKAIYKLPIEMYGGKSFMPTSFGLDSFYDFRNVTDCEVAVLRFATEDGTKNIACRYEISGNKITFTELVQTSEDGAPIKYKEGKAKFEYEFAFSGPYLTLTDGSDSMQLTAYCFSDEFKYDLEMSGYSLPDSPLVGGLDYFNCTESGALCFACMRNGTYFDYMGAKVDTAGRLSILLGQTVDGEKKVFQKQYAYIPVSSGSLLTDFGVVLIDESNVYYYTDNSSDREARQLDFEGGLTKDQLEAIAKKKSNLFDDLLKEFSDKGINVEINRATGEIAMDASVLFGGDSAEITAEGKALLDKFLPVYTSVIYNEKYNGFIKKTVVEGHTAPVAGTTYEDGLPLSKQRAENVKAYCVASKSGANAKLASTLEAVGYSSSKPIYDDAGKVDMDACRRVSFKFVVNTDEAE